MSVWNNNEFEAQPTPQARLAMLVLHIGEVQGAIAAAVSSQGHSRNADTLERYVKELRLRRKELEQESGGARAGSMGVVRFGSRRR